MECEFYREIKLLEHAMERVVVCEVSDYL